MFYKTDSTSHSELRAYLTQMIATCSAESIELQIAERGGSKVMETYDLI